MSYILDLCVYVSFNSFLSLLHFLQIWLGLEVWLYLARILHKDCRVLHIASHQEVPSHCVNDANSVWLRYGHQNSIINMGFFLSQQPFI